MHVDGFLKRSAFAGRTMTKSVDDVVAPPRANYGVFRQVLLKLTPDHYMCKLFCRGDRCKYCNPACMAEMDQAVPGLYSAWITDDILATSRPTSTAIEEYRLFDTFKKLGIKSVINLQKSMEHAECGPPLEKCGFSYDPEEFMKNDIFHYNFGWPDFGGGSINALIDMVKVMQFAVLQGKVAIHCHAGLGRTGVLICAYLMWSYGYTDAQALSFLRSKRPSSVQTKVQVATVAKLYALFEDLRPVFRKNIDLREYLQKQKQILYGCECSLLRHVPEIIFVSFERIRQLVNFDDQFKEITPNDLLIDPQTDGEIVTQWRRKSVLVKRVQQLTWKSRKSASFDAAHYSPFKKLKMKSSGDNHRADPTIDFDQQPKRYLSSIIKEKSLSRKLSPIHHDSTQLLVQQRSHFDLKTFCRTPDDPAMKAKCDQYKQKLNRGNFGDRWNLIARETDANVLLLLIFEWCRSLKEPILNTLLVRKHRAMNLTAVNRHVVRYIAKFFQFLCNLYEDQHRNSPADVSVYTKLSAQLMTELLCRVKQDEIINEIMLQMIKIGT